MLRSPLAIGLAAFALAAGTATASAHPAAHAANTKQDRTELRREGAAVGLINKATEHVRHAHKECRPSFDPSPTTFTDAKPSDALLSALGILRRPATAEDQLPADTTFPPFAKNLYRKWVRVAKAADGHEFFVVAAQDRARPPALPHACVDLTHTELTYLLEGRKPALRHKALQIEAQLNRDEHPPHGFKPAEAIFLFDRTSDGNLGGGGGGVNLEYFTRHGMFGSSGSGDHSTVSALIPDGVASIDLTFAREVNHGPHRDPKRYPSAIHLTTPVQDNVVSFEVDRPAPDAFPTRQVWRAADGSVVRVVKSLFG